MHPARLLLLLLAGSAALALGACGSSSKSNSTSGHAPTALSKQAYAQRLHTIALHENVAQASVQKAFRAKTVGAIQKALRGFADDQRGVQAELSELTPPADARDANAKLAAAFGDNAAATAHAVGEIAGAKSPKDAFAILGKDSAAQKSGQEIDAALARLKKLGYTRGS